jgi:hypothetical protein
LAVPVFNDGWKDSPSPSIDPGPLGTEIAPGPTALLSAAVACGQATMMATETLAIVT